MLNWFKNRKNSIASLIVKSLDNGEWSKGVTYLEHRTLKWGLSLRSFSTDPLITCSHCDLTWWEQLLIYRAVRRFKKRDDHELRKRMLEEAARLGR